MPKLIVGIVVVVTAVHFGIYQDIKNGNTKVLAKNRELESRLKAFNDENKKGFMETKKAFDQQIMEFATNAKKGFVEVKRDHDRKVPEA
jgi:predicted Holliday junction resolvase-like endonuclease